MYVLVLVRPRAVARTGVLVRPVWAVTLPHAVAFELGLTGRDMYHGTRGSGNVVPEDECQMQPCRL